MNYDCIEYWARVSPQKTAIRDLSQKRELTYEELNQEARRLANYLVDSYSIKSGDRVAVIAKNSLFSVILYYALQKIAAIHVPINFRLQKSEMDYILKDCQPKLTLADGDNNWNQFDESHQLLSNFMSGFSNYKPSSTSTQFSAPQVDDVIQILYTSGTTGFPKGALITRKMVMYNAISTNMRLSLNNEDTFINFMPFFHTGGWNVLITPLFHCGATVHLMDKFEPDEYLLSCEKYSATIIFGVPTTLQLLSQSNYFESVDLSSVRFAVAGGEPMPLPLIETWENRGIPLRQGYGLTEFGPNAFSLNEEHSRQKIGSVGFSNPFIELELRDESGEKTEQGPGELYLKGPMASPGYWNRDKSENEWTATGDLFSKDDDGFFFVVGRKKDMYISGGENVYPAEIEQVLCKHPAISEAAVIGIKNHKWGEVGMAFIVKNQKTLLDFDDVKQHCCDHLAKFKVPKQFKLVANLPKGDSGKILKRALTP